MRLRWIGQVVLGTVFVLIVWNLLESEFGKWTVMGWFEAFTPIDAMVLIAVALVGLLIAGSSGRPPSPPKGRTTTLW